MKKAIKILALSLVLIMSVMVLASCGAPNADPDKAIASLKDNGYSAAKDDTWIPAALKLLGADAETVVTGTADIDGKAEHVTIVYFDDADDAKAAWEKVKEYAEDKKEDDDSDWTVAQSGAMIYWGTSAGIKAAK